MMTETVCDRPFTYSLNQHDREKLGFSSLLPAGLVCVAPDFDAVGILRFDQVEEINQPSQLLS